jgi:hypothetical protein
LTLNINSGIFSISYDIASNPTIISGIPPTDEAAIAFYKGFLGTFLDDDLRNGTGKAEYLKVEEGNFVPAISLSEADITKVSLFRKPLGQHKAPSVTAEMPESNVWALITGRGNEIIAAEFHHFARDDTKSSTYPLITAEDAWGKLQNGEAYIANPGQNQGAVIIRKVYLAYFDPSIYTDFYQPVIVFEGDNNFYGYVPAISSEYYDSGESSQE